MKVDYNFFEEDKNYSLNKEDENSTLEKFSKGMRITSNLYESGFNEELDEETIGLIDRLTKDFT